MKPRILLTGKNGQIGSELCRLLSSISELFALGRSDLDLAEEGAIRHTVRQIHPHWIINAAAYTQVDQAEKDEATAFAVNAHAPALLAEEGKKIGAWLVHYSTDYVFDGLKGTPYVESDAPNPLNAYGKSKLAGEQAIRASGVPHAILRTAWVYATTGRNFLLTILRQSAQREELSIVDDQIGAPTWSREIAVGTWRILEQVGQANLSANSASRFSGIYHMTAGGETSWYGFAQAILQERSNAHQDVPWITAATFGRPQITRHVTPISTHQYPTPARRPGYSVLSNARLRETFGFQLPDWRAQLRKVFEREPQTESQDIAP